MTVERVALVLTYAKMKQSPRNPHFMHRFLPSLAFWMAMCLYSNLAAQQFHLGLNVAPNLSFSDARDLTHHATGAQAHFGYGFIFDAMFTETYAIGTGVNVFYTGGEVVYFEASTTPNGPVINRVELAQKLQYVEVPLTFKMRTKEIGYTTYYGQFGMGLGLNVRADGWRTATAFAEADSTGALVNLAGIPSEAVQVSLVDQTLLFRPSLIIALGGERRFTGTTALAIGIRYNVGLRNQYQAYPVYTSTSAEDLVVQFDPALGINTPVEAQMRGKTGQIELCVGLMF